MFIFSAGLVYLYSHTQYHLRFMAAGTGIELRVCTHVDISVSVLSLLLCLLFQSDGGSSATVVM